MSPSEPTELNRSRPLLGTDKKAEPRSPFDFAEVDTLWELVGLLKVVSTCSSGGRFPRLELAGSLGEVKGELVCCVGPSVCSDILGTLSSFLMAAGSKVMVGLEQEVS